MKRILLVSTLALMGFVSACASKPAQDPNTPAAATEGAPPAAGDPAAPTTPPAEGTPAPQK